MQSVEFLTIDEALEIHSNQIKLYGGSPGIRDRGGLESALSQPETSFGGEYLHKDIYEMAAAYLYPLIQNHPFIDGNKRVGTAAAIVFLSINGITISEAIDKSDPKSNRTLLQDMVLFVASGKMQKPEIAEFFRIHTKTQVRSTKPSV